MFWDVLGKSMSIHACVATIVLAESRIWSNIITNIFGKTVAKPQYCRILDMGQVGFRQGCNHCRPSYREFH